MPRAECTKDSPGEELYGHYIIAVTLFGNHSLEYTGMPARVNILSHIYSLKSSTRRAIKIPITSCRGSRNA
jgi:hypothetical protein